MCFMLQGILKRMRQFRHFEPDTDMAKIDLGKSSRPLFFNGYYSGIIRKLLSLKTVNQV